MFNLEEFENNPILEPIVDKLNKYLSKDKLVKVPKLIAQLEDLLDKQEFAVSTTYILSVLVEHNIKLISDNIIGKIGQLLNSENAKLKINSITIIGFAMLSNENYLIDYFPQFMKFLIDKDTDIRDNVHYFLQNLLDMNSNLFCSNKEFILEALKIEKGANLISLLTFLDKCEEYKFKELLIFRDISKSLFSEYDHYESSELFLKLFNIASRLFPSLKELDFESFEQDELLKKLDDQFLMKRYNFSEISKDKEINLKDFIKVFKKSNLRDERIYFYSKIKETNITYFYELEKEKLIKYFEKNHKLTTEQILRYFYLIESNTELRAFIFILINLKYINGYFSELGFYYPFNYLKTEFLNQLQTNGIINVKKFDYLPPELIKRIVNEISILTKQDFLLNKDKSVYYSLKKIQQQVNSEAAKLSSIDLKPYRLRLLEEDFIRLIRNLPREYLTEYHKGTQWLTNLGLLRVKKEIENSKIIGFYSIPKISEKLNISTILIFDIIDSYIDPRSGIFDNNRENFYYSNFLKEKIDNIRLISDLNNKQEKINLLAKELNIDKNHILVKIDENLRSIKSEIENQDQIKISEYLEKTGMSYKSFMEFIAEIDLRYFKKGDFLIFKEFKIIEAKNDIKSMLIEKSKTDNYISLGDLDITSTIVENLLKELQMDEKVSGIFYNDQGEIKFYTEKGLEKLMLENSLIFSFHDFFYGKELSTNEIELLSSIFERLIKQRKLKGSFTEETLTFSSNDVLFAQNYNTIIHKFEKIVHNYLQYFKAEFQKIKIILTKQNQTIFPQEIKIVQESIDRINRKMVRWRSGLEAFVRDTNIKLLKRQGYSIKRYKTMLLSNERKEEIKSFENDPEVLELFNSFNSWIKLFNELETKYGNIIFYQKRLIQNPEIKENREKLNELLVQLNLI